MSAQWVAELWRIGLSLLAALLIGLLLGHALWLVCLVLALFLFFHLRALYRLDARLRHSKSYTPPNVDGVWGEVYYLFYRSQQRQRKRKKLLVSYLNRFKMMTKAMPDATVVLRHGSEIEWFNEAAQRQLGLRHPQDLTQRIDNLIRLPSFVAFLRNQNNGEPLEIPSPDHEGMTLSIVVIPYGNDRRLLVARDVSQLHRLEETRRDFVANASHELRTPLTVINGYLETMADSPDDDPVKVQWGSPVKVMYEQSLRMTSIVDDLLMLSRLETSPREIHREVVDIPSLIRLVAEEGRELSGDKKHVIRVEVDDSIRLRGNRPQLYSVFTNLVFNAVHYTPAGGTIVIRWYLTESGVCFEVEDSGVGIAPQHIFRLTERFYRVDVGRSRDAGGTGLGLAIVKHILDHHDGHLTIESMVGKGSVFRSRFPLSLVQKVAVTKSS